MSHLEGIEAPSRHQKPELNEKSGWLKCKAGYNPVGELIFDCEKRLRLLYCLYFAFAPVLLPSMPYQVVLKKTNQCKDGKT